MEPPMNPIKIEPEETLDPGDWSAIRSLGHRMVDDMVDYLRTVRDRPVWRPVPDEVAARFATAAPSGPTDAAEVYREFKTNILPYPHGNIHPRFWGWVVGTGTPLGMLSEMLAAGMNSNSGFGDHAVTHVETQVLDWLRQGIGFGDGSGILTSGCSVANLTALAVARNVKAAGWGIDARSEGLGGAGRLTVYGSTETHSSNLRALEILGLGRDAFRGVPVYGDYRIRPDQLRRMIAHDVAEGARPFCVIGNAGTVNTGAFDDLETLAGFCDEFGLWLHVDGAFGSLAALSPRRRSLLRGIERADSLAFDLHKWLHVPYDVGGVLIRDAESHNQTFQMSGAYLSRLDSGLASGKINFMEHGIQMSRGFRALKVWMTIKEHGFDRLGRLIEQNIRQAQYLASLVAAAPDLELAAPVPLNVVCFRFAPPGLDREALDDVNRELLVKLHEGGVAAPSHTTLGGRFAIRAAVTNHRSRRGDFDTLVSEVTRCGRAVVEEKQRKDAA